MHGLQTLQKLNDARVALAQSRSKTPVADVVEGFFVFEPTGYEVAYHTADKLPDDGPGFFSIEFKGDDGNGPRFDVTLGKAAANRQRPSLRPEQTTSCNQTLDQVAQLAASAGLDGDEVAGRLGRLFTEINRN